MRCTCGREFTERQILSEAGRIAASRRKVCRGPKPTKLVPCRWCGQQCEGRRGLEHHLPTCRAAIAFYAGVATSDVADFFTEAGG